MTLTSIKTNFTAGELSMDMLGRGDLSAYANGAARLRNVFIAPVGGVSRRPGLRYIGTAPGPGRLVAFEFNSEQTYLLVLSAGRADVYAGGAWQAGFDTPWTAAQLRQIAWTQTADTLLVTHPDVAPRKITRTSHTEWQVGVWSFYEKSGVIYQPTHKFAGEAVTLQASASSGTVTLEAGTNITLEPGVDQRIRISATGVASQLEAGDNVTLSAGTDGRLRISAKGVADQLVAGDNISLQSDGNGRLIIATESITSGDVAATLRAGTNVVFDTVTENGADYLRISATHPDMSKVLYRDTSAVVEAGFWSKPVALAISGGVVTPDPLAGSVFTLTLTSNVTLGFPLGMAGKAGMFMVVAKQDATGGRTLALASGYAAC